VIYKTSARKREYQKIYNKTHRAKSNEWHKNYTKNLRQEAIAAYGGACKCCGETEWRFLTFDHIYNDGAKHRKEIGCAGSTNFIIWLRNNNWPASIQLLCWNCNTAKQYHGICPHKSLVVL
jgi:hypothetical protein